jgi:Flp pilus assembly protein protease CpaA
MQSLKKLWSKHPVLSNWLVLSLGFVIILGLSARHVGFTASQWAALIAVTILLAGLCAWIIEWE